MRTPAVRRFEYLFAEYLGDGNVLATCNATISLLGLVCAFQLTGKEVILSPLTFPGAITPFLLSGCKVRWCDVDSSTGCMDPTCLSAIISNETAAVVSTDYRGYPARLDHISKICKDSGATHIHDAASSLGSTYRSHFSGYFADVVVFSFGKNKPVSVGSGGAIWTADVQKWNKILSTLLHPDEQLLYDINCNTLVLNVSMPEEVAKCILRNWNRQIVTIPTIPLSTHKWPNGATYNGYFTQESVDFIIEDQLEKIQSSHFMLTDSTGKSAYEICPMAIQFLTNNLFVQL